MDSSVDELRRRLESIGVGLVLIGAHAANRYRVEVRHTLDVDFLATSLEDADTVLREAGCTVRVVRDGDVPFMISARRGSTVIDLLLAETDYQRLAMQRAIDGVLSPEDVIVHKLIAGRPRDLDDIHSVLASGLDLDVPYIEEHADSWGVLDRWHECQQP